MHPLDLTPQSDQAQGRSGKTEPSKANWAPRRGGERGPAGYDRPVESLPDFRERLVLTLGSCFFLMASHRELAIGLDHIRSEIEHMRMQVARQRREILLLHRAGIPTTSAEALLPRMLEKIGHLCAEGDRLKAELPRPKGRVLGGRKW